MKALAGLCSCLKLPRRIHFVALFQLQETAHFPCVLAPTHLLSPQWKTVSLSCKITLTSAFMITSFSFIYPIISFSEFDSSSVSLFYSLRTLLLSLWFSLPVMSNSLQPHGLQHARPPCPAPSPKVWPSSCPLHQWCHPSISSSDTFFSSPLKPSQHQGLFQWISCSHQMTKLLELQHQAFQRVFKVDFP